MCTLTLAWQVFEDAPVVVAANRDEALGRDSTPPEIFEEDPLIVAPRDAEAGGTWIGYNERGVFVGITNKWTDSDLAGERSRGLLVADALEARSAAEATSIVEEATEADEYSGFYLVIADAANAFCYEWDGALSLTEFDPGVHVVVNVAVDDDVDVPSIRSAAGREQASNGRAVRDALAVEPDETATDWLERAGDVLGDHEYGVCIHRDGYGTRSSSLIALGPDTTTYAFAPGPPCRTPYETVGSPDGVIFETGLEGCGEGIAE
ncbi:NRDE family protein [Natrinema halophilum]|uniref:NRDE family protein n=1 Tax=Natrinema halophilum TaxID=1699371 RepID=A0A7D5KQQ2_9EURY|nr:NRDE family protein [Natrinema halophilum]QLG47664.1 NRDE family protein [Natrinema halophilum]